MKLKLLGATAIALGLLAAPAFAQQAPTVPPTVDQPDDSNSNATTNSDTDRATTGSIGNWASDAEKSMYEENREMWSNFFTDDTMSTAKDEAEVRSIFSAMGADDQSQIKAACERVEQDRGSYGTITMGLCSQIGQL